MMLRLLIACLLTIGVAAQAEAGLPLLYTFEGQGNWSLDATAFASSNHNLFVQVPINSTIERAYFYASTSFDFGAPAISLGDTNYAGAAWTDLGTPGIAGLHAYRADVKTQMVNAIGNGDGLTFDFDVTSTDTSGHIDGAALVIVYSNAAEQPRQISLYDGFVAVGGTTITHSLPNSPSMIYSGSPALLSLGIGFSTGNIAQRSLVDINGRRLSSTAGGQNDGVGNGGDLITIGGFGDSPLNPPDPFHIGSLNDPYDDELYDLSLGNMVDPSPFIHPGDTQLSLRIENPGDHDDLVFFAGLNVMVPEPPALSLVCACAAISGFFISARRRFRRTDSD
jgi:hypothetical protein